MKFKTRLSIGFGTNLLLILILTLLMIFMVYNLNQMTLEIVKQRYEFVKIATSIRNNISYIDRSLNNIVLSEDQDAIEQNIELIYKRREDNVEKLKRLEEIIKIKEVKEQYYNFVEVNDDYEEIENNVIRLVKRGDNDQATQIMLTDALQIRTELIKIVEQFNHDQEFLMDQAMNKSSKIYREAIQLGVIITIFALLIGMMITFWVIKSMTSPLKRISKFLSSINFYDTNNLPRLDITSKDEIGEISSAFNKMAVALEKHTYEEENLKQKMLIQNWLESKVAEIIGMYSRIQGLQDFAAAFLSKVCPLIEATYGVFYIKDTIGDKERLLKIAAYAGTADVHAKHVFQLGEGLVGQCALENKSLIIEDIPQDYIKISSGLGDGKPTNLLLLPIQFEGEVIGVLEFASFNVFKEYHLALFERVIRGLGITMNNIWSYMEIQRLLEESQTLTEELQSQSEELQLQQEELKSINEKLEEQHKNSEMKTNELEKAKIELEENTKKLTLSSQYKSQFLANISHELRTPLNSLLILAQILIENQERNLSPKQVKYAQTIYSSGNDLLNLINDILDLTKIESGKVNIMMEEVNFKDLIEFVQGQFLPIAQKTNLHFALSLADDLPVTIKTDKHRLQQILTNLLSNAFKFTKHGGVDLIIKRSHGFSKEHLNLLKADFILAISVKDSGIGIGPEKLEVIFEAFQQADGTTSRNYGGTGLGLSISRELANLLGGYIEVESEEGVGSIFTLYIPVTKGMEEQGGLIVAEDVQINPKKLDSTIQFSEKDENNQNQVLDSFLDEDLLKNRKVLIVDDDMRNVFALTTILENKNIQVEFAENGKDGIKKLEEMSDFDLILMDIMMPEMDGFEAMKRIRSIPAYKKIPIIAITAKAMKNDKEKCIDAGASDYISKPINIEKLFSLMKVWLGR